jgi:RNase P/RNase MRP subunit POP5
MPVRGVRRRYLLFHLTGSANVNSESLKKIVHDSIHRIYGIKGLMNADLKLIEFNLKSHIGILRCSHDFTRELRVALAFIREINSKPASINVRGVSGTIKSLKKKNLNLVS